MTGGRLKRVARYLNDSETFLLRPAGDGLSDVNLHDLMAYHKEHGKLATVTVVNPPTRYGLPQMDESRRVVRFSEKPVASDWVSAGYFVLNRKVLDYIDGDQTPFELAPMEKLASDGHLMAFEHKGFFYPWIPIANTNGSTRRGRQSGLPGRCGRSISGFWHSRPVFVTGATGLVGSWLVRGTAGRAGRRRLSRPGLGAAVGIRVVGLWRARAARSVARYATKR